MTNRTDVVKFCAAYLNAQSYLEIGCKDDTTFSQVAVKKKIGVDPTSGGNVRLTSDQFFESNVEKFDLVFIDGDHRCRQAFRDITNSFKFLNENGLIIAHDCNPWVKEDESTENVRCGDAWKSYVHFRQQEYIDAAVGDFDYGIGILRLGKNKNPIFLNKPYHDLRWEDLVLNRGEWLNLLDAEKFKKWIENS